MHPWRFSPVIRKFDRLHKKNQASCNITRICITLYKTKYLELTLNIPAVTTLVQQCIEGDLTAYRQIYERYAKAMYNTALRITGNQADAEDILQEAFIDAYVQLRTFEQRSTFGAWLRQIVVYKSIGLLKKRRISFISLDDELDQPAEEEGYDEESLRFNVTVIKKAMSQLPDGYRAVVSLYLVEGYDHEEISEILKISQSTVRSQYKRGKQKLLELLKKENKHE